MDLTYFTNYTSIVQLHISYLYFSIDTNYSFDMLDHLLSVADVKYLHSVKYMIKKYNKTFHHHLREYCMPDKFRSEYVMLLYVDDISSFVKRGLLETSCIKGSLDVIKMIGVNENNSDIVYIAVENSYINIVEYILSLHESVNLITNCIFKACRCDHSLMAKMLVEKYNNLISNRDYLINHICAMRDYHTVMHLIEYMLDNDREKIKYYCTNKSYLGFKLARIHGDVNTIRYLVSNGLVIKKDNINGILITACHSRRLDVIRYMFEEHGVNDAHIDWSRMFKICVENKSMMDIFDYLAKCTEVNDMSQIVRCAVYSGRLKTVKHLVENYISNPKDRIRYIDDNRLLQYCFLSTLRDQRHDEIYNYLWHLVCNHGVICDDHKWITSSH